MTPSRSAAAPVKNGFVPGELDGTTWAVLEPFYAALRERPVESREDFERWLLDRSELDSAAGESRADLYIDMTRHTDDEEAAGAWTRYLDEVPPRLKPVSFELDRRQAELAEGFGAGESRYEVLLRDTKTDVELFREENVPIQTRLSKLDQRYEQIRGEQTVEFDGATRTIPEMSRFLQKSGRDVRERAWRAVSERMLADREAIDEIYDEMIRLRAEMAANAGFGDYRAYAFRSRRRFDYGVEECEAFHAAVEAHCVPFLRRLDSRRSRSLAVSPLRPWDLSVDEMGREPLRPFENASELVDRSRAVFDAMDPELGEMFQSLGESAPRGGSLDLETRKGKAPGGYQYMRDRSRSPFIFMNAAGLHRDVETMVHEAGHAFHSFLCADEPLLHYRDYPMEFAEVASMTMELLTMPQWDRYYPDPADADRARRAQLEGSISLLPWIATIDAFQHWIYTNPGHSRAEREAFWLTLVDRFGHDVSWEGLEDARAAQWQKQGHLFGAAFYYIEYGIAQLGALGLWLHALERGTGSALERYKRALAIGGARPLPELFAAAGVPFEFGPGRVEELVGAVERELEKLPE